MFTVGRSQKKKDQHSTFCLWDSGWAQFAFAKCILQFYNGHYISDQAIKQYKTLFWKGELSTDLLKKWSVSNVP